MTFSLSQEPPPSPLSDPQAYFNARAPLREAFLADAGWGGAVLTQAGVDCAFRRHLRVVCGERSAVLMESVPDGAALATPGHGLGDYLRIGARLRAAGVRTPDVFATDPAHGYILMEDFGDVTLERTLASGHDSAAVYARAADVLVTLRDPALIAGLDLPRYEETHIHAGRRRLVDWYIPAQRGAPNPDGLVEAYLAVWDSIERSLPPCPRGFLHGDFHLENLMGLPDGVCGVLDFQGAMEGPLPYDLANLLEDVRTDVPEDVRTGVSARYAAGLDPAAREAFSLRYRVLATQFHCRVAGQFIRLALRDGKSRYLDYLPRVARLLDAGLAHPVLAPLKGWLDAEGVNFSAGVPEIVPDRLRPLIRTDAF